MKRQRFIAWLKHAFAVDLPGAAEPTARQAEVIDRVCRAIVARRLTVPAIVALETARPLNYVTAQAAVFLEPVVASVVNAEAYREFAKFLERRGAVEYLTSRIEAAEAGAARRKGVPRAGDGPSAT
jgi:hypothetical protein